MVKRFYGGMGTGIDRTRLGPFLQAYAECALWSSLDNEDVPLDENYDIRHLAEPCLAGMLRDCLNFQRDNESDIEVADLARAGHDFWLTRNGHGAGFWDGGWPEDVGRRLTNSAETYGGVDLYVGDNGLIYSTDDFGLTEIKDFE